MKQIIEKVMKNLCHDGTMSTSKTHPNPPLKREGTKEPRHAELVSASHSVILSRAKNLKSITPHPNPLPQGAREQKAAFTLAEVLITLGIIGVVAALTLPTLIQNYQKQVWVNQLKKSVSVWENGMKMMLADAETDNLQNTEFWQSLHKLDIYYGCEDYDYTVQNNILKKYFKILKFYEGSKKACSVGDFDDETKDYKNLDSNMKRHYGSTDSDTRKIYMADGTLFGLWAEPRDDNDDYFSGKLVIDVNGENKGPNQWGRDTFVFGILPNGNLAPYYKTYEELKDDPSWCGNLETGDISNADGDGCSARIIADGWKMNY